MTPMATLAPTRFLLRGNHRFTDPQLARTAGEYGVEHAWREGFARLGPRVVTAVEGDFAVFLDDMRGQSFAAVDRFGIHPLCYRIDGDRLDVNERADALANSGAVIDRQAIFDYLYFHVIPAPRTIFHGVRRLSAGHYALMERGRLTVERWWKPEFVEDRTVDFGELRAEFNRLLRDAVGRSLDARSTGCFLSGGTDSSTVAGVVTEITGTPAKTYSIGFDVRGYDEMEYARIAARHFGTDHHEYYLRPDDVVAAIADLAASYDQPFGNSSVLPAYYCAKMAREEGVATMLAGDGGDELFGGNTRYAKQRIFEAYRNIPEPLRYAIEPVVAARWLRQMPVVRKAASYVEQARVPLPDRLEMYNLLRRLGIANVLAPDFLAAIDTEEPLREQEATYAASGALAPINRMLAYDWKYTLADNDLPKVVGATAYAGVDVAFPLLDDRLVDFSLRLPPNFKLKGSQLRWFFKQALKGFLPDAILAKKKHGFGLPFGAWATTHPRLRDLAFDSLGSMRRRGVVRPDFIERLTTRYLPEHPGYYGEMVWILMVLELWLSARGIRALT